MRTPHRTTRSVWARSLAGLWASGAGLLLAGGCVIEIPDDDADEGACEDVRCSIDGYCRGGDCFCERGFFGNPYALHGCQTTQAGRGCTTTCGLNSYCEQGACVCEQGFIAVCGTGDCLALRQLCDGVPDCPNHADESLQTCNPPRTQQWTMTDDCVDGQDMEWRLYSRDRDWAWPSANDTFVTSGLGIPSHEEIECLGREWICYGAAADGLEWGIGLDASRTCDDCCFRCGDDPVDLGSLTCE